LLDDVQARYVMVDNCGGWSFTRVYTLPLVTARSEGWDLAYNDPAGELSIYRRVTVKMQNSKLKMQKD
jgi:hypothetical protein